MHHVKPEIGQWYKCRGRGQAFEVVSIDDSDGTVELQDYDGNLDEVEVRAWFALDVEPVEAPEDWAAPLDALESDDVSAETDGAADARTEPPLNESESWQEAAPEEERDDWDEGSPSEPYIEDEPSARKRLQ